MTTQADIAAEIKQLRSLRGALTTRQLKTIRGQILAGDIRAARQGIRRILPASVFEEGAPDEIHHELD